jgi:hypothetical protein
VSNLPLTIALSVCEREATPGMLAFIQHQSVLHTERIEDLFPQEFGVALAADPLNDLPKHFVPGIAVFESGTRSEFQRGQA